MSSSFRIVGATDHGMIAETAPARSLRGVKPAIVTPVVPPSMTGQANMLRRLLSDLPADDYCLVTADHDSQLARPDFAEQGLPARHFALPVVQTHSHLARGSWSRMVFSGYDGLRKIRARARRIREILAAERCGAVVGCSGDVHDLPAAFWAAQRAGLPFYAYLFDYYSFQAALSFPKAHRLLSRIERYILTRAAGVIVPNEFLRDEYRRRYGVQAQIVRNSIDLATSTADAPTRSAAGGRIVYTGSVYEAQFDAFANLLEALSFLERPAVRLQLYTAQSPAEVARGRLIGPYDHHPPVAPDEALALQRSADILFLPLAFASPYPEIIKTSAPSKLGEYLAAGRPILAHAPADSFLAWYFRRHECGLIVDRPEPELLARAVSQLLDDQNLCARLIRNARACAAEFHADVARATFFDLLAGGKRSLAA